MDFPIARKILRDPFAREMFSAAVERAKRGGHVVGFLAKLFDVPEQKILDAVDGRRKGWRDPRPIVHSRPVGDATCSCERRLDLEPSLWICIDCGAMSPTLARILARDTRPVPPPESTKYVPGERRGGIG